MKRILVLAIIGLLCFSSFSMLAPHVKALETVIFQDDFESYSVGSFPSAGGWEIVWDGAGPEYQIVTDGYSHSPTKSLQLKGSYGWSIVIKKDFSSSSNVIGYECWIMSSTDASGESNGASLGFFNQPISEWGNWYAGVYFKDGYISSGSNGVAVQLQQFTPFVWYRVRCMLDKASRLFNIWIDDSLIGENLLEVNDPNEILSLQLSMGWQSQLSYFDDVKVFEVGGTPQGILGAYWNFDEGSGSTAADSSGNGNTGILVNGPVWDNGKLGKALSFDGADDYVQVPQSSSLDLTERATVEAWVYPRAYVSGDGHDSHIISRCDDSGGHIYMLGTFSQGNVGYSVKPFPTVHPSAAILPLNSWTHLAMTYDGSHVRLYINGQIDSGYVQSGQIQTTDNWLAIGCKPTGPRGGPGTYAHFNGMVDDVRIYSRALSQQEIQTDMGGAAPPTQRYLNMYPLGGIVTYKDWPYSVGVRVTDQSGTGIPNVSVDVYDPIIPVWTHGTTDGDGYFSYYYFSAAKEGQFELEFKAGTLSKKYKVVVRPSDETLSKLCDMWRYYIENYIGRDEDGNVLLGGEGAAVYRKADFYPDVRACTEGQGYTLLRAFWMNDKDTFNRVRNWTFKNMWETNNDRLGWFSKWNINTQKWELGEGENTNSAPDGDEDIALALILAYNQWRDPADKEMAKNVLRSMLTNDIVIAYEAGKGNMEFLSWGSLHGDTPKQYWLNPSYMAPYAYRIFSEFETSEGNLENARKWNNLTYTSYKVLSDCAAYSVRDGTLIGLVPKRCILYDFDIDGNRFNEAIPSEELDAPDYFGAYGYDSFRTMWRLAIDVQWNSEKRALDLLQAPAKFFYGEIQNPLTGYICAMYDLDGTSIPAFPLGYGDVTTYGGNIGAALYWESSDHSELTRRIYSWLDAYVYNVAPFTGLYRQNWVWFGIALHAGLIKENTSELKIALGSPANIFVQDSLGRGVGTDPNGNQVVNEIPGTTVSLDTEQVISISNPAFGPYRIQLTGIAKGHYTINATLFFDSSIRTQVFSGNITSNEVLRYILDVSDQTVTLRMLGDINGDHKFDMRDISQVAKAFGSCPNHSRWNPQADLNLDYKVDGRDFVIIAKNFGKTYT